MLGIYHLLLFLLICQRSDATCPQKGNGIYVFGPGCGFMCHCRSNKEQCDDTTGKCRSGCASFWYGPGCQYRDIAEGELSRHSDNLQREQHKYSLLANDGDTNTCSYTAEVGSSEKKVKPFWRVWFPANETIRELQIVTLSEKLNYFKGFSVFVEYLSPAEKKTIDYAPLYSWECYKHGDDSPNNVTFTVLCNYPVVGNQVRIELDAFSTQLVLCDVRINGGRNLAFGRKTSQSSLLSQSHCGKRYCTSDKAVDGEVTSDLWHCSNTADEKNPWWKVDLGHIMTIWYIRILPFKAEKSSYAITVSNDTEEVEGPIYDVKAIKSTKINITLNIFAEIVKLTKKARTARNDVRLAIREVYIFGDCLEDKCGYDCSEACHCKRATVWVKISGDCTHGCKDGWYGPRCNTQCKIGFYGPNCSYECSAHCTDGRRMCSNIDGICRNGCKAGWIGTKCNTACPKDSYGDNCSSKCSENCVEGLCRNKNGKCTKGCTPGWKGKQCDERCNIGTYGINCSRKCSTHCKGGNSECDHVNGSCLSGCNAGWSGHECDQACDNGRFGKNCRYTCSSNCLRNDMCDKVHGQCSRGCKPGFTGKTCQQNCSAGSYGTNCSKTCSAHCEGGYAKCSNIDGSCLSGCNAGWNGRRCDQKCDKGRFGRLCMNTCPVNCKHDNVSDSTNGQCPDGWCNTGTYGINCSRKCSTHCKDGYSECDHVNGNCLSGCNAGWSGHECDRACDNGRFGQDCRYTCSSNCLRNDMCDKVHGQCSRGCKPGFTGKTCQQKCDKGRFGRRCMYTCPVNCKHDTVCDSTNGQCPDGCKPGYIGIQCAQNCTLGFYGDNCSHNCSDYCEGGPKMCSTIDGHCRNGCKVGRMGTNCDIEDTDCDNGTFGPKCKNTCSPNCFEDDICDKVDGQCPRGCKSGFTGNTCQQNCKDGLYGPNCSHICSAHCEGGPTMCSNIDGRCLKGCKAGWKGTKCISECKGGFYGINCASICGNCKSGTVCHKVVGACSEGCETGYSGDNCLQVMQKSDTSNSEAATAGGVVSLVIGIVIVVAVTAVIYRKRKRKDEPSVDVELTVSQRNREKERKKKLTNVHLNAGTTTYAEANSLSTGEVNIYNNDPDVGQTKTAISIANLLAYTKGNLAKTGYFLKEFQEIPFGMKQPSTVGIKACNKEKNKYKDLQAYDHTRVVLNTLSKEQGTDYINASFIKGYAKDQAYIAAQGPMKSTVNDFWRMIWEQNIYTIAMVTNVVEEGKRKCLQYWPTFESSTRYGDFTVYTESEAIYAEFTIRKFKVSFKGKPSRNIRQFHFTAWPDKSVPRSTSSLLQFWTKVRNNDENKSHTWLVHCSAGVGRTGTFIATDMLYDQGKDNGFVDVYQCVRDLRDQRVNMVQTKDQYIFLHGMMIEAFVLPSEPVTLDNFHQVLNDLKDFDVTKRRTKLRLQYEVLKEDVTNLCDKADTEDMYTAAMLKENRQKNRCSSILPPNEFRPFLITSIPGCTNYINAVYIPSYFDIHGYIISQIPLKITAIDCCRLVYEQEVKVIVTFPTIVKDQTGTYLPEHGKINLGPFTMTKMSEEDKHFYKKKKYVMAYNSEEYELTQLVFKYWPEGRITPSDLLNMLKFIQEVEYNKRVADNKPVLVQCLDGSEKSGLFVVLMNILERARLDNQVSIPQVIRQLRIRRQQLIPNFEQFKFCYDVLLCHVDSNTVYANA